MDSGNLVLFHDEKIVWESFHHPTDTTIPYLKIGVDKKTNMNWFLTSWKSREDPGTGEFMLKMDLTELPEVILQKGQKRLWRTGPWIGGRWIGIPMMKRMNFFLDTIYVNNQYEVSVTNTIKDGSLILERMVVNESGVLQRMTWHESDNQWFVFRSFPTDRCDNYGKCGSYGYCDPQFTEEEFECTCLPGFEPLVPRDWFLRDGSDGCLRKKGQAACDTNRDGFFKLVKAKLPATGVARVDRSIVGVDACGEACRKNCTCTAYASGGEGEGSACVTWHGELVDIRVFTNGGWDLYVRVNELELAKYSNRPRSSRAKRKRVTYIAISISTILVISLFVLCWSFIVKRRKERKIKECETCFAPTNCSSISDERIVTFDESKINTNLHLFDFNTIVKATSNFSISNTLGEGGFGKVYKGQLRNGKIIAVKRLATNSKQGGEEFKNEVFLIAKLQHINLVKLLGCCVQQHEKMLIYEYMPNKGLDSFIFDKDMGALLKWEKRFGIILGITRGLMYLHQDSRLRVVHRDLKASNILLDNRMNPKISDFGMARIFERNQMEANTKRIVGTYGYMSPEYAMRGLFSIKSDVFSFGVILLELITGRKNNSYHEDNTINLIGYVSNNLIIEKLNLY
ncbi:G-type lectin S-receptor-like serine/threonine-protein kinase RKS1 [Impatiens glandulifera]|uniref:G-type lectin S-receptor-like serine/threonine-protein kinase RKS1 n=1 Tax=Impatiens glandulifera TaxID=253017 RepID=UPI001FB0979B|nr:G-type lectin S-receptor-like serine/threonine-protein kinase RKS1 [Impatiens glandulifera]